MVRREWGAACRRALGAVGMVGLVAGLLGAACDDSIAPDPVGGPNRPPETWLFVQSDSLGPQFYKMVLRWHGSDPDGRVASYRLRWTCLELAGTACQPPESIETAATVDTFALRVPGATGRYGFEVRAVDEDGGVDPTPARQEFHVYNTPPVVNFEPGTLPTRTLPATTFYLQSADPDSTADPEDRDSRTDLLEYRAWLDGPDPVVRTGTIRQGSVTFRPEDFGDPGAGRRTVTVVVVDDGGAVSAPSQWSWDVEAAPDSGILLVDDCHMGGFYEDRSDQSYRNVLAAGAPGRYVVLDVETIPRQSRADFEASLSLFDRVVWYTDADTDSSGALGLSRAALDSLLGRSGRLFLCSGVAFGRRGAFGDQEARFRDLFGIEVFYQGLDGSTNFGFSAEDTVQAAVWPGLDRFHFLTSGLGATMRCFGSRDDAATDSLYFFPESTYVRATVDPQHPFVNPVRFDIGVQHRLPGGGRAAYVSFPIGLPINDNQGENEAEIREILRRLGILGP